MPQHNNWKLFPLVLLPLVVLPAAAVLAGESAAKVENREAGPTDWTPLLPPGPGKEYAVSLCNGCHTAGVLALQRRSRQGWRDALEGMNVARMTGGELCACIGGPIEKDEIDILSSYLSEAFGPKNPIDQLPLNVNTASLGAMQRLPGIEPGDARKIEEFRKRANFKTKQEIEKLLGREKFQRIEDFIDVRDSNFRTEGLLPM